MDQPDREVEPYFTYPTRQFFWIGAALAVFAACTYLLLPTVAPVVLANLWLNGFILGVFVIGVLACFWQVWMLRSSVNWIVGFTRATEGHTELQPPRLLAPLAALLRTRGARMQISSASARSILDSVATRIDELRDITRYIVNLLIFLGLLGTFYGLATTVPALVETIRSLAPQEGEPGINVFNRLMTGLEAQLDGMGVAFSSSLLGLAGSLVVGLLELFAGHGQNRFYRELEEWLSTITRLGFSTGDGDGVGSSDQGAMVAVLDHMAEQMESLHAIYTQSDISRAMVDEQLGNLATSISQMTARMDVDDKGTAVLERIAEGQMQLVRLMEEQVNLGPAHVDAESRMRLRSIDVQMLRILEEMAAGRQETTSDLRTDIAALTRAVRLLARDGTPAGVRRG
ncbi:MAG: biopolymer transporter ExbB [Rhodobacter sp.]|nr:biopolymer transporter ExbB [Rhodobacter sp.]